MSVEGLKNTTVVTKRMRQVKQFLSVLEFSLMNSLMRDIKAIRCLAKSFEFDSLK